MKVAIIQDYGNTEAIHTYIEDINENRDFELAVEFVDGEAVVSAPDGSTQLEEIREFFKEADEDGEIYQFERILVL